MSNNALITQTDQQWAANFAAYLVGETTKLFNAQEVAKGVPFGRGLSMCFLSGFISSTVFRALNMLPPDGGEKSAEALHAHCRDNFLDVKHKIQEAVAAGFEAAVTHYSRQPVEYYCELKMQPAPATQGVN